MADLKPSYTSQVFKHWLNLTFLAVVFGGGLTFGFPILALGLVLEGLALWVLPDFPVIKQSLDSASRIERIERQRWYYLRVLWGVDKPDVNNVLEMLFSSAPNWTESIDRRFRYASTDNLGIFVRLCKVITNLRELQVARPNAISNDQLLRLDEMINGWLGLAYLVANTEESLTQIDQKALVKDFEKLKTKVEKTDPNDRALRTVLGEQLRTIRSKVDSLPKLERRKALAQVQADTIVQQIEAVSTQARSSVAIEAGVALDTSMMMDSVLSDGNLDEVELQAEVRGVTSGSSFDLDDPTVWDDINSKLGTKPKQLESQELPPINLDSKKSKIVV